MNLWNEPTSNRAYAFSLPDIAKKFKPWEKATPEVVKTAAEHGECLVEIPSNLVDRNYAEATTVIDIGRYGQKLGKYILSIRSGIHGELAELGSEAIEGVAEQHRDKALIIVEGIETVGPAVLESIAKVLSGKQCPVVATIFEEAQLPTNMGEFFVDTYEFSSKDLTHTPRPIVFDNGRLPG